MKKRSILFLLICGIATLPLFARTAMTTKSQQSDSTLCLIEKYNLEGKYRASIIPQATFIKFAGDRTTIQLKKVNVNRLQLLFSDFHTESMPYSMSVDIKMDVRELAEGVLEFEGEEGLFRAGPVDKSSKKKCKISKKSSIKGSYMLNKNKENVDTFNFGLKPGFWIPVNVHIKIKELN